MPGRAGRWVGFAGGSSVLISLIKKEVVRNGEPDR